MTPISPSGSPSPPTARQASPEAPLARPWEPWSTRPSARRRVSEGCSGGRYPEVGANAVGRPGRQSVLLHADRDVPRLVPRRREKAAVGTDDVVRIRAVRRRPIAVGAQTIGAGDLGVNSD